MRKLSTFFTFMLLALFLSVQEPYAQEPQAGSETQTQTVKEFDQDEADSLIQAIRDFFDELLDVRIGWDALLIRHISNVGYGIDNAIGLNGELKDTLGFARLILQSEIGIRSYMKYNHFWPNLINRKEYSPTAKEITRKFDSIYGSEIKFD